MRPQKVERPFQVVLIAMLQFAKGGFLLVAAAFLKFSPNSLPHPEAFSQMLYIAARGKELNGILVPAFGLYLIYIGIQLLRLRRATRRNLAISSALTIALSLQRLGIFGESNMTSHFDRQTLYIIILLDLTVYIYLTFHPEITKAFNQG
jgi:hypothetical protein